MMERKRVLYKGEKASIEAHELLYRNAIGYRVAR
jgi:hypothetical protein